LVCETVYITQYAREPGATIELYFTQWGEIGLQNPVCTVAIRAKDVSVESKAMRHGLAIRNFATETVDWEMLVLIVLFKDAHDAGNSFRVCIWVGSWINIMKRLWISRLTIGKCEVNSNMHVYFASSKDVIQEGYSFLHFESSDGNTAAAAQRHCLIVSPVDHLSEVYLSFAYFLVVSTLIKLENLEHDRLCIIVIAQCIGIDDDLVPDCVSTFSKFSLSFVNRLESLRYFPVQS
jgi:hypothetical protein